MRSSLSLLALPILLSPLALAADETTTADQPTSSTSEILLSAAPGHAVNVPDFPFKSIPAMDYEQVILPGPQFLFSDEPEYIRVPEGVAMREPVEPGAVRLYMYNVNGVKEPEQMPRRINAVIRNEGGEDLNLRFLHFSSQPPSGNYHGVGKNGLRDYFASEGLDRTMTLAPGESAPLDSDMESRIANYNDLVHGLYEFVIDQPATVSVVQTDPETGSAEASERLGEVIPIEKKKNAGRGKFGVSNYLIRNREAGVIDTTSGVVQLLVADDERDPWVRGIDSSSGEIVDLAGNYGVMYEIELNYKTPDGKGLALVTWNSRFESSQWCGGMAASVRVSDGLHEGGIVPIPSNQLNVRKPPEVAVIQVFPPVPEGETGTIHITYSPPGASCLPVPLIFVPVDMDSKSVE